MCPIDLYISKIINRIRLLKNLLSYSVRILDENMQRVVIVIKYSECSVNLICVVNKNYTTKFSIDTDKLKLNTEELHNLNWIVTELNSIK